MRMTVELDSIEGTGDVEFGQINLIPKLSYEQRLCKFMLWHRMIEALLLTGWQEHTSDWDPLFHVYSRKLGPLEDMESIVVENQFNDNLLSDKKNANVELHLYDCDGEVTIVPLMDVAFVRMEIQ